MLFLYLGGKFFLKLHVISFGSPYPRLSHLVYYNHALKAHLCKSYAFKSSCFSSRPKLCTNQSKWRDNRWDDPKHHSFESFKSTCYHRLYPRKNLRWQICIRSCKRIHFSPNTRAIVSITQYGIPRTFKREHAFIPDCFKIMPRDVDALQN